MWFLKYSTGCKFHTKISQNDKEIIQPKAEVAVDLNFMSRNVGKFIFNKNGVCEIRIGNQVAELIYLILHI